MPLAEFHISQPTSDGHLRVQADKFTAVEFSPDEQRELLEALARVHGFSLVDQAERRTLTEYVEEVRHPEQTPEPNIHLVRAQCSWRKQAEALADAVAEALDLQQVG